MPDSHINQTNFGIPFTFISIFLSIFLFGACSDSSTNSPEPAFWEFKHEGVHVGEHAALGETVNYEFDTKAKTEFLIDNENHIVIEGNGTIIGTQSSILVSQINQDPPVISCVLHEMPLEAEFSFRLIGNITADMHLQIYNSNFDIGANNIEGCFGKTIEIAGYEMLFGLMFSSSITLSNITDAIYNGKFPFTQPIEINDEVVGWRIDSHVWKNTFSRTIPLDPLVPKN